MITFTSGKKKEEFKTEKKCCQSLKTAQCCAKESKTIAGCHD